MVSGVALVEESRLVGNPFPTKFAGSGRVVGKCERRGWLDYMEAAPLALDHYTILNGQQGLFVELRF